jgi:uncharacterized protein YkwD
MPTARALAHKRLAWALVGSLVAASLLIPSGLTDASANAPKYRYRASEKCFMRKVNQSRAANGQRRLNWDKQLGYVARRHARTLARQGGVWHDQNLGRRVTRWRSLGQNTGAGGRCRNLYKSFMASAPHRANILGRWRFIGVGTQWRNHRLYVQTIFESKRNPGNVWSWP